MQVHKTANDARFDAEVIPNKHAPDGIRSAIEFRNIWQVECYDTLDLTRYIERSMHLSRFQEAWEKAGRGVVATARLLKLIPDQDDSELFELKWADGFENLVVNTGLDDILDKYYKGSAYTAAHYVGLLDAAASPIVFAAADDEDTHAGWTEITAYSEAVRQTLTPGTVASQSVDNSASKAAFSINGTANIEGALLSTSNDKTPASPIGGLLVAAGSFTGAAKSVESGDTLNVTVTLTAASA